MSSQKRGIVPWSILAALGLAAATSISALIFLETREGLNLGSPLASGSNRRAGPLFPSIPTLEEAREPDPSAMGYRGYPKHPLPGPHGPSAGAGKNLPEGFDPAHGEGWKDALNSGGYGGAVLSKAHGRRDGGFDAFVEAPAGIQESGGPGGERGRPSGYGRGGEGTLPASARTETMNGFTRARNDGRLRKQGRARGEKTAAAAEVRAPGPAEDDTVDPGWDGEDGHPSDWGEGFDAGLRARGLLKGFKSARARRERARGLGGRKPPTLKSYLGKALKPPEGALRAPSFSHLKNAFPERAPDGGAIQRGTPLPAVVEGMRLPSEVPEFEQWRKEPVERTPHWHRGGAGTLFFHKGKDWGSPAQSGWVWMVPYYRRWWTVADGAQRLIRHQEHWWWKTRDGWFVLHGGEPWSYRHFPDWKRAGFWNPGSGVKMLYSEDASRVALIAPNGTWIVYDAADGREVVRGHE